MAETKHFINHGYGWTCKRCAEELNAAMGTGHHARARFFTEGEAEERRPALSSPSLARWRDAAHNRLICPRCGVEEPLTAGD